MSVMYTFWKPWPAAGPLATLSSSTACALQLLSPWLDHGPILLANVFITLHCCILALLIFAYTRVVELD